MKRISLIFILTLGWAGYALAQGGINNNGVVDVLGAHNVYGRGCIACHAPHSGSAGNGVANATSTNSGDVALWGQDLTPFYGQTLTFGGGSYTVTIPNYGTSSVTVGGTSVPPASSGTNGGLTGISPQDGTLRIAQCLSCHDGNVAVVGMMKGSSVETVHIGTASFNPPTLLGKQGQAAFNYSNDHPVGPSATFGCGGQWHWDCTVNADGSISFNGTNSAAFVNNYFDVTAYGAVYHLVQVSGSACTGSATNPCSSASWVTCTTCHDQHSMSSFNAGANSKGTVGIKNTHFFVRGWYDPGLTATSNNAAQFCRSCHGGASNEAYGQMSIPTT